MATYGMMAGADAFARCQEYAVKALSIDPNLSQPHAVLATVHERNFRRADVDREFNIAIALNPNNATAHHWYSVNLWFRGRTKDATEEIKKAKELDPLSPIISANFATDLIENGNKEKGLEMLKEIVEMNSEFLVGRINLAFAYVKAGKSAEAVEEAKNVLNRQSWGQILAPIANLYARAGLREGAFGLLGRLLKERSAEYIDPFEIAGVYAVLGEVANALDWLEKAVTEKSARASMIKYDDSFLSFRDNPRFRELVKKVGLD